MCVVCAAFVFELRALNVMCVSNVVTHSHLIVCCVYRGPTEFEQAEINKWGKREVDINTPRSTPLFRPPVTTPSPSRDPA